MATPSGKEKIFTHFMKAPDFELTHNADSHYPDIEPHYHEFYELSFFVSGHVSHIIADQSVRLQNGDLAVIPPLIFCTIPVLKISMKSMSVMCCG